MSPWHSDRQDGGTDDSHAHATSVCSHDARDQRSRQLVSFLPFAILVSYIPALVSGIMLEILTRRSTVRVSVIVVGGAVYCSSF